MWLNIVMLNIYYIFDSVNHRSVTELFIIISNQQIQSVLWVGKIPLVNFTQLIVAM